MKLKTFIAGMPDNRSEMLRN
jgi:hypothetical protein